MASSRWRLSGVACAAISLMFVGPFQTGFAQSAETPAQRCSWEGWLPPQTARERVRRAAHLDPSITAVLIARTRAEDKNGRMLAAEKLGAAQDSGSLRALLDLTADRDPMVQEAAIRSLGRMGASSALPVIAHFSSSPNAHLRQGAVWALGQLQNPAAIGAVVTASADTSKHVRNEATWALGLIGGKTAATRVKNLARDVDPHVRLAAVCSLDMIHDTGDPQTRQILAVLGRDSVELVRQTARWAATRLEPR